MEVNDLKTIWKKANDQDKSGYWVSDRDVKALIKKKSKAVIADVERQLKQKILMSSIIGLIALAIGIESLFNFDPGHGFLFVEGMTSVEYGVMMIVMSASVITVSIHARIRHKQVRSYVESANSLKTALITTRNIFKKVISFGIWSDTLITPLVVTFIVALKLYKEVPFAFDERIIYLLVAASISAFIFSRLGKYLMNRRFGRFVNALDDRLEELEAIEIDSNEKDQSNL